MKGQYINFRKFKVIFIIIFLIYPFVNYAQISDKELIKITKSYIKSDQLFNDFQINSKSTIKSIDSNKGELIAYISELKPTGFIILAPSKELYPIVGYSNESEFNFTESENNTLLNLIKSDLGCQLYTLKNTKLSEKQLQIIERNKKEWNRLIKYKGKNTKADHQYGPNLSDIWGGVNCKDETGSYVNVGNRYTPNNYSPGCVATSTSQIMHMFEWPPVGRGEHTNEDNSGSSTGDYYSAFGRKWYDWDNMLDEYHNLPSTPTQRNAMGALAYQCGTAHNMDYEYDGSTANIINSPSVLSNYFRFTGHHEDRSSWTDFWPRMRENIEAGYAVQLAIRDVSSGAGHANVCDGYRYDNGDLLEDYYYHMNNGWWGTCNAWYRLLSTFSNCGYDAVDAGVFDILPEPMFEDNVTWDAHNSKTFTISWNVSKHLDWDAFELQEDKDNSGTWTTLSNNITDTFYVRTVPSEGVYKYRVRAKSSGNFYLDSYSEILRVPVEKIVYLNFDGDDSFYLKDNQEPEYGNITDRLDISNNWTIETWFEIDSYSGSWDVITDRKTVFSMYLIDDSNSDFAVRFVARDSNGNIIASLSSETNSDLSFQEWIHIAISRDGSTTKMFLNGIEVAQSTDTDFSLSATTNALNIGARYWSGYERYIDGRIDELRISDIARYNSNFCPDRFYRYQKDDNTRVLLHMDAFIGDEIKEYSYNFINPVLRSSTNDPGWSSSTCPIIINEPEDISLCEGSAEFSVTAVQTSSYQWQEDSGSGFANLSDGGVYSGSTTTVLSISDIAGMNGYKYRCIATGSSISLTQDCSREALLSVYPTCTTWDGSTWSNGEPDLDMSAVIAGDYTLSGDISAKEFTILSGYNVIVSPNLTLTVQNDFENHGTILLQSDADNNPTGAITLYGSQNNYGTMTAQRFITVPNPGVWGNWHLVSLPFDERPTVESLFSGTYHIYQNIEPDFAWQQLSGSDKLPNNEGFLVQLETTGQTIEYSGNFGNDTYSSTLPLTSGSNLGWFLSANPYPSPIDWNATTGWTKNNIRETIYTFDPINNGGSNQYSSWDGTVGTYSGSRYINAFQGYFVQAIEDGAELALNNNVRVKNSDVSGNYLKNDIEDIVKLEVIDPGGKKDEVIVYTGETESKSIKVAALDNSAPNLASIDSQGRYVIRRLSKHKATHNVPLSLESEIYGEFSFSVVDFNETNYDIFLSDKEEGVSYEIREGFNLSFETTTNINDRFELIFTSEASSSTVEIESIKIYSSVNSIHILRTENSPISISVYSTEGKLMETVRSADKNITISGCKTGVYIVRITGTDSVETRKVFVK
ncbi:MAG: C10 family peptidase [Bacteroidota bacterium]|nr:C10 family peptidase [Bacteroidota bacterium]